MKPSKKPIENLAVAGIHAVDALLNEQYDRVVKIWIETGKNNERVESLIQQARQQSIAIEQVKPGKLDSLAAAHQGVIAWCKPPELHNWHWLKERIGTLQRVLVLDRITDCHNFGACVRTAEAAGFEAVLVPPRHSSALNTATAKAASGALYRIPLVQLQLPMALDVLAQQRYSVIGLSEHANASIYQAQPQQPMVLALGSEEQGLSKQVMENCTQLVSIPCVGINSSLNVSVAAGVAMFTLAGR